MRKIVAEDNPIERARDVQGARRSRIFEGQNDALKVEIIAGHSRTTRVSCYRQKDFIDLCRGPHVPSTGTLGVFKLTHTAGAYWKGDEKNPMLQRIYGASLPDAEGARRAPEAARGGAGPRPPQARQGARPLLVSPVGAGVAVLPCRRARSLYNGLLEYLRDEYRKRGYQEVLTPQIFDAELFKLSGHYAELPREHVLDGDRRAGVRRQADELPGALPALQDAALVLPRPAGAVRRLRPPPPLRALGRDGGPDARAHVLPGRRAHLHAVRAGRGARSSRFLDFADAVYGAFGFTDVEISLGLRPEKRIGTDEQWDRGEEALAAALEKAKRPHVVTPGRRRLLRPEDRLPREGRDRAALAARHDPVRLRARRRASTCPTSARTASAHRPGRHAPRDPRLVRALHRDPDRAHGGRLPVLDRAGAGGRAAGLGPVRRGRARAAATAVGRGAARRERRQEREARRAHPPGGAAEGARACWSSARRRPRRARSPSACATAETPGPCRWKISWRPPVAAVDAKRQRTDRGGERSIRRAFASTNRSGGRRSA